MIDELEVLTQLGLNRFLDPRDLVDATIDRRNNPIKGISAPWSKLQGMFDIPKQGVTLLGGHSGHQKSTVANQWAVHALGAGYKVCIASLELTTDSLFEMLAGQSACLQEPHEGYLRKFGDWCQDKLFIVDHHDVMEPDEVINMIIDSKRLLGCDLFLLDCLFQVDIGGELEQEKRFVQRLAATARDYDIAILVVHHVRKSQSSDAEKRVPNKHDFIGSSHLTNAAAAVLILWQDKVKAASRSNGEEVDDDKPDFILSVAKNRFGPYEGAIGLYQHDKARLLCNSRARQYKPLMLEDTCQSDGSSTGESASQDATNGSTMRTTHGLTPRTEQPTQRTGTEYLSWMS